MTLRLNLLEVGVQLGVDLEDTRDNLLDDLGSVLLDLGVQLLQLLLLGRVDRRLRR